MQQTYSTYIVETLEGQREIRLKTTTQPARVLNQLIMRGRRGVTALEISNWALRMSEYIRVLRHDYGLNILMEREEHISISSGPGWHGRYYLIDCVRPAPDK